MALRKQSSHRSPLDPYASIGECLRGKRNPTTLTSVKQSTKYFLNDRQDSKGKGPSDQVFHTKWSRPWASSTAVSLPGSMNACKVDQRRKRTRFVAPVLTQRVFVTGGWRNVFFARQTLKMLCETKINCHLKAHCTSTYAS